MPKYGRILLKLSGEVLAGEGSFGIDASRVAALATEVAEVARTGVQIGLVVGGGNFFRGVAAAAQNMDRVAADPQFVRREDVTEAALAKEREIQRARAINEGKPEKMADKIVEGRMNKYFEEVCLYEQPFIKENTTTIGELIKTKIAKLGENISVSRFVRFKVGDTATDTPAAE